LYDSIGLQDNDALPVNMRVQL